MLASIGVTATLRRGAVKMNHGTMNRAEALPGKLTTAAKRFLGASEFVDPCDSSPDIDYEEVLKLVSEDATDQRIQENLAWAAQMDPSLGPIIDDFAEVLGRAWGYLQREIPRRSVPTIISATSVLPCDLDLAKFKRRYSVVDDPMILVRDMLEGSMAADQVAAFSEVYPELHEFFVAQVLASAVERQEKNEKWSCPWPKEQLVYMLMKEGGMDPESIRGLQAVFNEQRNNETGGKKEQGSITSDAKDTARTGITVSQSLEGK